MRNTDPARIRADEAAKEVTGTDPRLTAVGDAAQSTRFLIATFVKEIYDAGVDRMLLIEMLLAGAAFVADNHSVSREELCKFVANVSIGENRELIVSPGGR